jgi:hypothetical protein
MKQVPKIFVLFLALVVLAFGPAAAQSAGSTDQSAIQSVISRQIGAFQNNDGAAAYSAASPGIQSRFPSVADFMAMVAGQYQPVYRPRSVAFGTLTDTADGPVQRVFLVGPDGASYVAEYLLQKQPDGTWKINGVNIVPDGQPSI